MSNQNYAGIDIAKRNFVIGIRGKDKTRTETNNPKGFAHTVEYLQKHNVSLIVMESTGGLEIPLAKTLHRAGFRVVIANPRMTKKFSESFSLAKTDELDAKTLAAYVQVLDLRTMADNMLYIPPGEAEEELEALVKRRSQPVDIRSAEKNRPDQIHESQRQSVTDLIARLDGLTAALDKDIDKHTDTFGGKGDVLTEVKGIGSTTCATLLSMPPELGTVPHKRIAMPAGVVPPPNQSADTDKKTGCTGGRMAVRNMPYMAALTASRHEPKIKAFYQRLRAKGKPFTVAINACMHKLLRILNARMRDYPASLQTASEQPTELQNTPQCA